MSHFPPGYDPRVTLPYDPKRPPHNCYVCGCAPGEHHVDGCSEARCSVCFRQDLACGDLAHGEKPSLPWNGWSHLVSVAYHRGLFKIEEVNGKIVQSAADICAMNTMPLEERVKANRQELFNVYAGAFGAQLDINEAAHHVFGLPKDWVPPFHPDPWFASECGILYPDRSLPDLYVAGDRVWYTRTNSERREGVIEPMRGAGRWDWHAILWNQRRHIAQGHTTPVDLTLGFYDVITPDAGRRTVAAHRLNRVEGS